MARQTRMEIKQRIHKRPQFVVAAAVSAVPPLDPATDEIETFGRVPRRDFRGFPLYLGYGPESQFVYI